jgi:hypothetical protein
MLPCLRNVVLVLGTLATMAAMADARTISAPLDETRVLSLPAYAAAYDEWLRVTELSSVVEVVGVYDVQPRSPRYVLHLGVPASLAQTDATARGVWTAFSGSSVAVGLDVERRILFKFARLLEVPASDVTVVIAGREQCWNVRFVVDEAGFRGSERACGSAADPAPIASDALRNISRRVGARTARPRVALLGDARASVEERLVGRTERLSDQVLATRLEHHFGGRGRYRVLRQSDHLVEVVVEHLRGEVIAGERRWERLQIALLTSPAEDGRLQVVLVLDGQYAPGVGARSPTRQSYRDMEPEYAELLSSYAKALLNRLVETDASAARGATRTASQ